MKKEQNHHNILHGDCGSNTEFMNEVFVAVILSICLGRCGRCWLWEVRGFIGSVFDVIFSYLVVVGYVFSF